MPRYRGQLRQSGHRRGGDVRFPTDPRQHINADPLTRQCARSDRTGSRWRIAARRQCRHPSRAGCCGASRRWTWIVRRSCRPETTFLVMVESPRYPD
jgi:hypothetical protein